MTAEMEEPDPDVNRVWLNLVCPVRVVFKASLLAPASRIIGCQEGYVKDPPSQYEGLRRAGRDSDPCIQTLPGLRVNRFATCPSIPRDRFDCGTTARLSQVDRTKVRYSAR